MAKVSFIDLVQPSRDRSKMIEWPIPGEGERPKVTLRALGANEKESAHLAVVDYFKNQKPKRDVKFTNPAFFEREQLELVFRAYRHEGEPIADSVEDLAKLPDELIDDLHAEWFRFQKSVTIIPATSVQVETLIEALKKNILEDHLSVLPSSWLLQLITTMASQLPPSTTANSSG